MPARCSTSASAPASRRRSGGSWSNSSRPIARTRWPIIRGSMGRNDGPRAGQRMPGGQSRWSQGKDLSWEPLRPELVVEVAYEHMQGARFRHMAQFRRWRTDKKPSDCTYAQLEVVPPQELMAIFVDRPLDSLTRARSCVLSSHLRHSRVGSSSGSGVSCGGRSVFGHVAQIHADARPGGRSAAHRIDQHIVDGQERRRLADVCSSIVPDPPARLLYPANSRPR